MDIVISKSNGLQGEFQVPGDKSISHRALLLGSLANGISEVEGCSVAADPRSTRHCLECLGVRIEPGPVRYRIYGRGLYGFQKFHRPLDAGNSGTTIRLLSGVLSGQKFESTITGDESLSRRPMRRIMDPLRQMGAQISGTMHDTPPLQIRPSEKLHPITYAMPIPSAQVKSSILLAGLYTNGKTTVVETVQSRDHTERMLGLQTANVDGKWSVSVQGGMKIDAQQYFVPGDISAAAFLIVAALITPQSDIVIKNVGLNPTRTQVLEILRSIGGTIEILNPRIVAGESIGDIHAISSTLSGNIVLQGSTVTKVIDEVPILAVASAFSTGSFHLHNAEELRKKESDRISAIVINLRNMGLNVEEYQDGLSFETKRNLKGTMIDSFQDHRIAMAFGIAGLQLSNITVRNAECVDISFPGFWKYIL